MPLGKEWLTTRELRVELIDKTRPLKEEGLTEEPFRIEKKDPKGQVAAPRILSLVLMGTRDYV
jgi:hypothetical protein